MSRLSTHYSEALHQRGGFFDWVSRQEGLKFKKQATDYGDTLFLLLPPRTAATIGLCRTTAPTMLFQKAAWAAMKTVEWSWLLAAHGCLVLEASPGICWPDSQGEMLSGNISLWIPFSPATSIHPLLVGAIQTNSQWNLQASDNTNDRIKILVGHGLAETQPVEIFFGG